MVEAPYRRLPIHSFRKLRTALLLCLVSLSPCSLVPAQQLPMPVLHHRSDRDPIADMDTASRGRTTLPLEASGEYLLSGRGGTVEMDLEPDRLSGYITRPGDQASDEGTPLTFFFPTSALRGEELSFTTRQVHGTWFSFRGTIVRGTTRSRMEDGYYLLEGTLVLHDATNKTDRSREVSLPREHYHF
jgi:hypothetical protein